MQRNHPQSIVVVNVVLLVGNLAWMVWNLQRQSEAKPTTWFLDSRTALLERIKEDSKTQEEIALLDKALSATREVKAMLPEEITLEDIHRLEDAFLAVMIRWSAEVLAGRKQERVPLLPIFAEKEARQVLTGHLALLQGHANTFPGSQGIEEAVLLHEAAILLLEEKELTLSEFLECCRRAGLENAKATKNLLEQVKRRENPEA